MSNDRKNPGKKSNQRRGGQGAKPSAKKSAKGGGDEIRLNKFIANSGMCSRREADMHISIGTVTVNGKVVTEMGYKVKPTDEVKFDGARIYPERKAYVLLNKPKGYATTTSGFKGNTVMDLVANSGASRLKPIGRLGRNSMGLLLLTNDDAFMQKFTNSKTGVKRLFHVELDRNLKAEDLKKIQEGMTVAGNEVKVVEASYIKGAPKKEVGISILNTGNSVLRTVFEHLNYDIVKIDCVMIGELTKKDLPRGRWRTLTEQEIINVMHF